MTALILNGVSYSDNFSTIVRVSRTAKLSVNVRDQDGPGRDPLPTYLKHARLDMGANTTTAEARDMAESPTEKQSLVVAPKDPT